MSVSTRNETGPARPTFQDATRAVAIDGKPNVLRFGDGVDLWVMPSGLKTWRTKVQRGGKRTTVNLGHFPAMSIKDAKAARMALRSAVDPARDRRAAKVRVAANTLREVAEKWIEARSESAEWSSRTLEAVRGRFENYLFPKLGAVPVSAIDLDMVADFLNGVKKGIGYPKPMPPTAVLLKIDFNGVMRFAVRWRMIPYNPVAQIAEDLPRRKVGAEVPRASVATIEEARAVLAAVEARASDLDPSVVLAHRLLALTGLRKGELLRAEWSEIDFDAAVWTIPAERMKGKGKAKRDARNDHPVALAPQAVELLRAALAVSRDPRFVFSTIPGQPLCVTTLNGLVERSLIRAGLVDAEGNPVLVPHGWRAAFSTIMNELEPGSFRVIDVMLAHTAYRASVGAIERASTVEKHYNRARHVSERHRIAGLWADMLLEGRPGAFALIGLEDPDPVVVPFPDRRAA